MLISMLQVARFRTQYQHGPKGGGNAPIELATIACQDMALFNCTMANFVEFDEMAVNIQP